MPRRHRHQRPAIVAEALSSDSGRRTTPVRILGHWLAAAIALLLAGCVGNDSLTREEMGIQNRADAVVSQLLFERELDTTASYNVHKDGFVVIKFDASVPPARYTEIVDTLRASPDIRGVRAEQSGREVCPLQPFRR